MRRQYDGIQPEEEALNLLEEFRNLVKTGLSKQQKQEIAKLPIRKITVRTETEDNIRRSIAEAARMTARIPKLVLLE